MISARKTTFISGRAHMLSYLPFFSRDPFMLCYLSLGSFFVFGLSPDGSTLSSGREPPNFCPGGAVGFAY
jgi:hypothetical protein